MSSEVGVDPSQAPLMVFDYSGTARSGKGSIVEDLATRYPNIAVVETGLDYRAVTRNLLDQGLLTEEMPDYTVATRIAMLGTAGLTDLVARRQEVVDSFGIDLLHTPDVNGLVGKVSPVKAVREVVKTAFKDRVAAIIEEGEAEALLVDGRNLASLVRTIPGTRLVMSTFVTCTLQTASKREADRLNIRVNSPEFDEIKASLEQKYVADSRRMTDQVRPESDAIDYWHDEQVSVVTAQHVADTHFHGDLAMALDHGIQLINAFRRGVGTLAVTTGRQIKFDTSPMRERDMLNAANIMFEEGRDTILNSSSPI